MTNNIEVSPVTSRQQREVNSFLSSSSYIMLDFFMSLCPLSRGFVFFCPLFVRRTSLWS